ncbi:uncharacterized protein [Ciconia boyciana]|uniref:uncharacterized protein isoform X3 n=1 Tax=Ciconia boyciana TaxID=52775 RepID=UPI003BA366B4
MRDPHPQPGGGGHRGAGGAVALAGQHRLPGASRLRGVPHRPRLGPHRRTLLPAVSRVAAITVHPAYHDGDVTEGQGDIAGDLALARLDPPATPTRLVRPICLPGPAVRFPPGTNCTVTGWGDVRTAGQCHPGMGGRTHGCHQTQWCCQHLGLGRWSPGSVALGAPGEGGDRLGTLLSQGLVALGAPMEVGDTAVSSRDGASITSKCWGRGERLGTVVALPPPRGVRGQAGATLVTAVSPQVPCRPPRRCSSWRCRSSATGAAAASTRGRGGRTAWGRPLRTPSAPASPRDSATPARVTRGVPSPAASGTPGCWPGW